MRPHRVALASLVSHSIGNVAYRLASLLLVAIYATQLGAEAFGRLEQLLAVSMLLVPLVSWQVQEAFLAVHPKGPGSTVPTASALISIALLIVVLAGTAAYLLGVADRLLVVSLVLLVATTIAWQFTRNVVRNLQHLRNLLVAELCQAFVMLSAGLAILWAGAGFEGAVISIALGNIAACSVAVMTKPSIWTYLNPLAFSKEAFQGIIGVATKLLPNVVLWWVIELSDRLLLAYYLDDRAVGVYSAGARMAGIGMAACLLIYQSWQVSAIRALGSEHSATYFKTTLPWFGAAVSLVFSALLCVVDPLSAQLFGGEFTESARFAAILIPGLYIAAFCYFFGVALYLPNGPASAWRASLTGFLLSVSINVLLIPAYGSYIAALASFLAYSAMLLIRVKEATKVIDAKLTAVNFYGPLVILCAQASSVLMGLSPAITALGFILLVLLRQRDIWPFLRSIASLPLRRN